MKLISPENLFVADGDIEAENAIIEMSESKALLYIKIQDFTAPAFDYPCDLAMSIVYDKDNGTISIRGRMRFQKSGNKTVLSDKKNPEFNDKNLAEAKALIDTAFEKIAEQMLPIADATVIEFAPNATVEEIIKTMNDSGKFNIAVSSNPKKA